MISLADMKTFLGVSGSDQDAFLTLQIQLVSDAVEGYCKRKFATASYVQTYYSSDVMDQRQISLFHFPVSGTPVVVEKDEAGNSFAVSNFRHNNGSGVLTKNFGRFFENTSKLEVTYTAGYVNIPALVQNVVYSVVQERFNKKNNGIDLNFGSDVQRISIPGTISIDFDYSLNNNERKSHFGSILGSHMNVLDSFRSERTLVGSVATYVN